MLTQYSCPLNLVPLLGGKKLDIFDLACKPSDPMDSWIQMTNCFTKQFFPSNLYYWLESGCYPNTHYPVPFVSVSNFVLAHAPCLSIAQITWVYSTLTHRLGERVFLRFRMSPLTLWLNWIVLMLVDFAGNFLQHFPLPTFGRFFRCRVFLRLIWLFLWHINVFNNRQEMFT